jgi:ribonuclease P protein component
MEPESLREDGRPGLAGKPPGRLTRRAEFQRVSRGRRASAETFTLQSRRREGPEADAGGARVGFTVTRKVGNAVVRNRIRRRLKEALRAAWPLEAPEDRDYVLMAKREALGRRFRALVEDVRAAFRAAQGDSEQGRRRGPAPTTGEGRVRRPSLGRDSQR